MEERAPELLLIVRERLLAGREQDYAKTESEIAAACARLNCPHPYLALVPVAGPREVWWFNTFASQPEKAEVERAYARNEPLMTALRTLSSRKAEFIHPPTETLTKYRADLSGDSVWRMNGARFFVVVVSRDIRESIGPVFESSDGQQFVIASTDSRDDADRLAARGGPGATVLAVEPKWSFPDPSWVAVDPVFWETR